MAYQGYRIKINGDIFPNVYMSRGSYTIANNPRVCETYTDSLGIEHDVYYPTTKAVITFDIKEHSTEEHSVLDAFFVTRSNVPIQYFDDNTESYKTGTFKIEDFEWSHSNALASDVDYETTSITLKEY